MQETIKKVTVNNISFAYLEKGQGKPVLCLHGFPDTAYSFQQTLDDLATAGFRAIAPFMRGYHPSGSAPDGDYSVLILSKDVTALIDALCGGKAYVIGHDWGAFAACTAANLQPEKIEKLVLMGGPHMHTTKMSMAQLRKSWYVLFFQLPWLPERAVAHNNFNFIDRLYKSWSPHWNAEKFHLEPVKESLAVPGVLKAAITYYRSMIRGATKAQRKIMSQQTTVPTMYIIGESDGAVGIDQFENIEKAFTAEIRVVRLKGVGHFPHREDSSSFRENVTAFFK